MACDLCGKSDAHLEPVNDIFRTDNVKMICQPCASLAQKQIDKIRGCTSALMRNLVKEYFTNLNREWRKK